MIDFGIEVGEKATFAKTIAESDIYLFAGITCDLSPNHVDREFMKGTAYGRRIAHGSLLMGYMSTASTMILQKYTGRTPDMTAVSLGYDRVRFLKPVFINDTITATVDGDEADDKIIAVMRGDAIYGHMHDIHECPPSQIDRLKHYFLTYKDAPGQRGAAAEPEPLPPQTRSPPK